MPPENKIHEIDPDAICYLQKRNAKIGTRHYRNLEKRGITKAYTCWIYAVRTAAGLKFSTWAWLWLVWYGRMVGIISMGGGLQGQNESKKEKIRV